MPYEVVQHHKQASQIIQIVIDRKITTETLKNCPIVGLIVRMNTYNSETVRARANKFGNIVS